MRIVLGSTSPQRSRIFRDILGLSFESVGSSFAEDIDKRCCSSPSEYCLRTTKGKMENLNIALNWNYDMLVCADTIVVTADGAILEKPVNEEEAIRMLGELSGRVCEVISSCIVSIKQQQGEGEREGKVKGIKVGTMVESTKVYFATLTLADIHAYIATSEPYTKSGGFGYQSLGATLIRGIEGDYYVVEGFPCHAFAKVLTRILDNDNGNGHDHADASPLPAVKDAEKSREGLEEQWSRAYDQAVLDMRI